MTKHIHGGDVYKYNHCLDFSANCNPLGTPQSVKQAIIDCVDDLGDYPRVGCGPLREAIASYEHTRKEYLICGNGAADLIFSLCRAQNPKKALLLAPTFAEYEQALVSMGCEIARYYLEEPVDFCVKENYLQVLQKEKPDIIFLCNPNNPTGITMHRELLEGILRSCAESGIFMVVDECFLDFTGQEEQLTLVGKLNQYPNLFILRAFTKMYAMAGVRLGFGITADTEVIEQMYQAGPPWNVSVLAGASGKAALKEDCFVKETVRYIQKEKEYLYDILDTLKIQYRKSTANYILLKADTDLKERLISEGILIRDCSNYRNLSEGYYRIAVKSHEDNRKLTAALTQILGNK